MSQLYQDDAGVIASPWRSSQVLQLERDFKNWLLNALHFHPLSSELMKHKVVIKRESGDTIWYS